MCVCWGGGGDGMGWGGGVNSMQYNGVRLHAKR